MAIVDDSEEIGARIRLDGKPAGKQQRNRVWRGLFMNLEAVIKTVRRGPEVGADTAAKYRVLPSGSAADCIVPAGHHSKGAAIAIQDILGKRRFAENGDRAIRGIKLLFRQQVRACPPRVDMSLDVRQSELYLAIH